MLRPQVATATTAATATVASTSPTTTPMLYYDHHYSYWNGQLDCVAVLDAMGKLPTGILTGQTIIFGDYDQCMGISHSSDSHTIEGQFCGMALKAPDAVVGLVCAVCARARVCVCVCVSSE